MIQVEATIFKEALVFTPPVHDDNRGTFQETYSKGKYDLLGLHDDFVQGSMSFSFRNVIRGLHGDDKMSKLVQCVRGRIYDVIVDFREDSPTCLKWQGFYLTESNRKQVYVPAGFLHGFFALTDATVLYSQSSLYDPASEINVRWNDPTIGIKWPGNPRYPIMSEKDLNAPLIVPKKEVQAA